MGHQEKMAEYQYEMFNNRVEKLKLFYFAGLAIIRDGLVLDMSEMKRIDIDLQTETAWVEAGVTVKDLDDVTCPQGLAAVNGSCTTVGVVGFTLGGGFGFLSRTQGLAVDNCLQLEMITATGQRVVASPQEHEQLFWALRGAGQVGYGVVTKAQVKLHKLQEKYVGGEIFFRNPLLWCKPRLLRT